MDTKEEAIAILKSYFNQNRLQTFIYYDSRGIQHNYQLFIKEIDENYSHSSHYGDIGVFFRVLNADHYWIDVDNFNCCVKSVQYIRSIVTSLTNYDNVWVDIVG